MASKPDETREGVDLTNLDQALFDDAGVTKRELVDYLDAVSDRILPGLAQRPLSVIRVHRGSEAFMQKNVPKYTPDFVPTVKYWAETSKRDVSYALCEDRRTLLWFANQRAVEYHPTLVRVDDLEHVTHLVLDLDPPSGDDFGAVVAVAHLVREALDGAGLAGAVKTSGAKGVHIYVPLDDQASMEDVAAAARAWPGAPRRSTRRSPPPPSSRTTARARSSSTPPGSAGPRSSPPTAPGCGPACRCRSPWRGTTSTRSTPPTSPCARRRASSATPTRGPSTCPSPST